MRIAANRVALIFAVLASLLVGCSSDIAHERTDVMMSDGTIHVEVERNLSLDYIYSSGLRRDGVAVEGEYLSIFVGRSHEYYSRPRGGAVDYISRGDIFTSRENSNYYNPDAQIFLEANRRFDEFKAKYKVDELVTDFIRANR